MRKSFENICDEKCSIKYALVAIKQNNTNQKNGPHLFCPVTALVSLPCLVIF